MYEGTATSSTAGSTTSFGGRRMKSEALKALNSRFTEGPLHNPQCLPVDLCCGPRAFLSAAPPLASSAEAGCVSEPLDFLPGSDFSKNNIFQGCLSTSALGTKNASSTTNNFRHIMCFQNSTNYKNVCKV